MNGEPDPRVRGGHEIEIARIEAVNRQRNAADTGDRYTHFNPGNLFIIQERERHLLRVLRGQGFFPLSDRDILEVGCGGGYWLRQLVHWGADPARVVGVELDGDRAAAARRGCPSEVRVVHGDASRTDLPDDAFDLVFQFTVFTSILDEGVRRRLADEMLRVVRPGGRIVWYDFRYDNPSNPDVRGVTDGELARLFPGCDRSTRSLTLAPFLARRLGFRGSPVYALLAGVPFLRTHLLSVIRPGSASEPSAPSSRPTPP